MASKVIGLIFIPFKSSASTKDDNSIDRSAKKINKWAVLSTVFLILGVAATTVGTLGVFNIFIATTLVSSKLISALGISSFALSILSFYKFSKTNSSIDNIQNLQQSNKVSKTAEGANNKSKKVSDNAKRTEELKKTPIVGMVDDVEDSKALLEDGVKIDNELTQIAFHTIYHDIFEEVRKTNSQFADSVKRISEIKPDRKWIDLIKAVREGNLAEVESLIKDRVEINKKDIKGRTPLIWATIHNKTDVAISLIRNGAYVDLLDTLGLPAIFWAILNDNKKIIEALLQKTSFDSTQKKILAMFALLLEHNEIVQMFGKLRFYESWIVKLCRKIMLDPSNSQSNANKIMKMLRILKVQ
ncbi:MAG: hypothetical protein KR126chlam6_00017 [Candidatus Anoxychlamydiales bacterium]|nr:hypothetical protein [Candidatus Anoxychlamydiales bacterium]